MLHQQLYSISVFETLSQRGEDFSFLLDCETIYPEGKIPLKFLKIRTLSEDKL